MATFGSSGTPAASAGSTNGISIGRSSSSSSSGGAPSAQLNAVLAALMPAIQANNLMRGERQQEIGSVRDVRGDYSKEAAFADSQALMAQQLEAALAESMGTMNRATDGAGASGNSLRALLAQQAAQSAAQSAAALGAQQAVQYGGISNTASGVLEMLTRPDATSIDALMNALAIQQRAQAESASMSSTSAQGATQKTSSPSRQQGVKAVTKAPTQGVPFMSAGSSGGGSSSSLPGGVSHIFSQPNYISNVLGGLQSYGPSATPMGITQQLTGLLNTASSNSQLGDITKIISPNPWDTGIKL